MKNRIKISYFSHAFMMLAFMGAVTACVNDEEAIDNSYKQQTKKEGLAISPTVSESDVKVATTRAASVVALQEKALNTLDVFVEHVTDGTGDGTFLKQYHLTSNIIEKDLNMLAERWRKEGLVDGEKYNIYVAANNPLTVNDIVADDNKDAVTKLKELTFNEVTEGIAVLEDGDIGWKDGDTSGNIYKLYSESITGRAYTKTKEFMMDGVINNWTPDPTTLDQVFDVTMNRAAAKIVLNVKFDTEFLKSLAFDKDDDGEYTKPKAPEDVVSIKGTPAWKFNNFAFGAPVFTPATTPAPGVEVHNSGFNIFHNQKIDGGQSFTITTYSYPNKWTEATSATSAPSLVLSIGYEQNGNTTYNYYRVPIVPKTTTSLNRNTQYVINATIATRGSETHEDVNEVEDIFYKVTSWNNEDNEDQESGDVTSIQHYYLQVNPKVYTLRGDGEQSVDINFSRAKNTSVAYKLFTFDNIEDVVNFANNTPVRKTAVDPDDADAVKSWYFSDDKHMKTVSSGVTITNNNPDDATAEETEGSITVTSTALTNRAIKYILMRVYLNEEETFDEQGNPTYYEDVLIRHFPTDNIQSDAGLWSSRNMDGWWSFSNGTGTTSQRKIDDNQQSHGSGDNRLFSAKYYNSDRNTIYFYGSFYTNQNPRWQDMGLENIYKYIIQISSTSEQYVMGRPALDAYSQSKDHVVSPSFMIASQLGATINRAPDNNNISNQARIAARHCATYMEVDVTGNGVEGETRWTGWRLPTREEVGVIIKYQHAGYDTMEPVMTGRYYWTLEGAAVATGINSEDNQTWYSDWATRYSNPSYDYQSGRGNTYIRCIRDLSATEIENLNKWNTIIAKFQAKHSN